MGNRLKGGHDSASANIPSFSEASGTGNLKTSQLRELQRELDRARTAPVRIERTASLLFMDCKALAVCWFGERWRVCVCDEQGNPLVALPPKFRSSILAWAYWAYLSWNPFKRNIEVTKCR